MKNVCFRFSGITNFFKLQSENERYSKLTQVLLVSLSLLFVHSLTFAQNVNTFPERGHVGIGTDTPQVKLQINHDGASTFGVGLLMNQYQLGNSDGPKIQFQKALQVDHKNWTLGINHGENHGFVINEAGSYTSGFGFARLAIAEGGNIGIGTLEPSAKLDVRGQAKIGDGSSTLWLGADVNQPWIGGIQGQGLRIIADGVEKMRVTATGQIGIGTSTPQEKLEVLGRIRLSDDLIQGGDNSWIFHSPDDGRQELFLAPFNASNNPDWAKGTIFYEDGSMQVANNLSVSNALNVSHDFVQGGDNSWIFHSPDDGRQELFLAPFNAANHPDWANGTVFYEDGNIQVNGHLGIDTNPRTNFKLAVDGKIICEELRVAMSNSWPDYVFSEDYGLMPLAELAKHIETEKHLPGIPSALEIENEGVAVGEMQRLLMEKIEELTLYVIQQQQTIEELKAELNK